jgi:asparagine synthase (glutamine-hydrolysing)
MHFMHAIAPLSPFKDILKLPPAHYLTVSQQENHISRYWQCSFTAAERYTDVRECALEVERCLDETVSLMCKCDVPVGALLSGGLDSSCVVASMGRQMEGFPTFRISSLDDAQRDEFKSAQQVAQSFKTDHREYHIESNALMTLAEVVRIHGEPVATAVPIDAFLLAKEMKKHVTVALCGAGGDELFGGYREHNILHMLDNYFTRWRLLESTGFEIELGHSREEQWAWSLYQQVGRKNPEKVFTSFKYDNSTIFKKIYSKQMQELMAANDPMSICAEEFKRCGTDSLFDNFIGQQLNCVSQYSTTEINDRAGMSSSVEIRSPFLDVNMVELSFKIPPEFKVAPQAGGGKGKQILRSAMGHRLPSLPQSDWKTGFGGTTPYKKWLTEDHVDFMEKKLQSPMLADSGMFNLSGIQELFMLYQCGVEINWDIFIGLASTAIWLEEFF